MHRTMRWKGLKWQFRAHPCASKESRLFGGWFGQKFGSDTVKQQACVTIFGSILYTVADSLGAFLIRFRKFFASTSSDPLAAKTALLMWCRVNGYLSTSSSAKHNPLRLSSGSNLEW